MNELTTLFTAISAHWATNVDQALSVPTIYGNEKDQINKDGIWCRLSIRPGTGELVEFTPEATHRIPGVLIPQLFGPLEKGDSEILALADQISPLYRRQAFSGIRFSTPTITPVGKTGSYWQINLGLPFIYDYVV